MNQTLNHQIEKQLLLFSLVISLLLLTLPVNGAATSEIVVSPCIRLLEKTEGEFDFQTAIRTLKIKSSSTSTPTIYLVAVTHIGTKQYYESIQNFLEDKQLVLFEGVGKPEFMAGPPKDNLKSKTRWTKSVMDYLSIAAGRYLLKEEKLPKDLTTLHQWMKDEAPDGGKLFGNSLLDAWQQPIIYDVNEEGLTLHNSINNELTQEITLTLTFEEVKKEAQPKDTIQSKLAAALALEFQLDAIDYDKANFENCDMTREEMQEILSTSTDPNSSKNKQKLGEDFQKLVSLLEGSSFAGKAMRGLIMLISWSKSIQMVFKLTMAEMINDSQGNMDELAGQNPRLKRLFKLLIEHRNQIVLTQLNKLLSTKNPPEEIVLFYGAGHIPHLQEQICQKLAYQEAGDQWLTVYPVNLKEAGITPAQLPMIRQTIRDQMSKMKKR
jgi:hypothetical protein